MSIASIKLNELKRCIGEKKLKQLGLIPCKTCAKIAAQAQSFADSYNIKEKAFLTEEEMSNINKSIAKTTFENINNTSDNTDSNTNGIADKSLSSENQKSESPVPDISISSEDMHDEATFIKKLATILKYSQPANTEDLGIGYLYSSPTVPLPHAITCTECGRLYAISHPDFALFPLPVYLTDSEYELIKGVYVDILL